MIRTPYEYNREYYLKNRNRLMKNAVKYAKNVRNQTLKLLGGKCCHCGFSDKRALQIDHVNGGGMKEYNNIKIRGTTYYNGVKKSFINKENKYQLLCANCNWIKRQENNECRKSKLV